MAKDHFLDATTRALKPRLKEYIESVTYKVKEGYVCPFCKSGEGPKKTGAYKLTMNGLRSKCFVCGARADIIGLYAYIHNMDEVKDYVDIVKGLCLEFGEPFPGDNNATPQPSRKIAVKEEEKKEPETVTEFTALFLAAAEHIKETDYPQRRGLSEATINHFTLGYIEQWKHPKAPASVKPTPRLIIPISKYSYLARDTREEIPESQEEYKKQKVAGKIGANWIYHRTALEKSNKPIFIVEGEIDALSIIDIGGEACALGSLANIGQFLKELEAKKPTQPLIICLDNDEAGQKAQEQLETEVSKLGFFPLRRDICGPYKDANERLVKDREGLARAVKEATEEARREKEQRDKMNEAEAIKKDQKEAPEEKPKDEAAERKKELERIRQENGKKNNQEYIGAFLGKIKEFADTPEQSTGFRCIDNALDGGFYEGLYFVGAVSSLGKTTFVLQIADHIAKEGKHILIFSLEMARLELMAKSISRETFEIADRQGDYRAAKDVRHITNGKLHKLYTEEEKALISEALRNYDSYANNIFIQEGVGDISIKQIKETIEDHIKTWGQKPIVIIDYLQILDAPEDKKRNTDKQIVDHNVRELKRLSRELKLTVLAISSFNRDAYNEPVSFSSFKESGGIEYSSDVLIGLQYEGMDYKTRHTQTGAEVTESTSEHEARITKLLKANNQAAENGESIKIEVKILKNRNGHRSTQKLYYYPKYNCFSEAMTETELREGMRGLAESETPKKGRRKTVKN